jgi:hypothetical protein
MNSYSIYVPRLASSWNEKSVTEVMERFSIGMVCRVDFRPVNFKPGFNEHLNEIVMSAFIHFDFPYILHDMTQESYASKCNNPFWEHIENGMPYRLQVNRQEYWICLKNKYPVLRTRMNIHQVVDNCRHLETIIEMHEKKIALFGQVIVEQVHAIRHLTTIVSKSYSANTYVKEDPIHNYQRIDEANESDDDEKLVARKQERTIAVTHP